MEAKGGVMKSDLLLKPHNLTKEAWWYEEGFGITVVQECHHNGCRNTVSCVIPWRALKAAIARLDK